MSLVTMTPNVHKQSNFLFYRAPIAVDARMLSEMYFSGEPRVETVIKFNEYGADINRFKELAKQRMRVINEGRIH